MPTAERTVKVGLKRSEPATGAERAAQRLAAKLAANAALYANTPTAAPSRQVRRNAWRTGA